MTELNLNDLTLENVGSWPSIIKLVAMAVVFVLILVLGYVLSFKDQRITLRSLQDKEIELLQNMEHKQQQAANLPLLKAQLQLMQVKFGKLLKQLPGKSEIPELLEEVSRKGIEAGLKFQLFNPQQEIEHDFYIEHPIQIIVDGSYHQIADFISGVAGMSRIVTLHDFDIHFPDPRKLEGKKPIRKIDGRLPLFMTITAKTYRYRALN